MCTVSYLPTSKGYIVTSNRDESPDRAITQVAQFQVGAHSVHFPRDPKAGGSWFATASDGRTVCLLNGAFEPFDITVHYPDSRGTALLNSLGHHNLKEFSVKYDFTRTAPFTMLMTDGRVLEQLIWDGQSAHYDSLDPGMPHFWSSVTLYAPDVRKYRRSLFEDWLRSEQEFTAENIVVFHEYGHSDDPVNGFVMNRDERVKTLSITCADKRDGHTVLLHRNLPEAMSEAFKVVINHEVLVRQA